MAEPREALAEALQGLLTQEQMETLITEVLATTKKVRAQFNCKHCGRAQIQFGETSDAIAVSKALPDLLNQAYGRPVEADVAAEPVRFIRLTNLEDLPQTPPVSPQEPLSAPPRQGRPRSTPYPPDGHTAA